MFSYNNPTNNYSSTSNNPNPCSTMLSQSATSNNNNYGPANCYRPLQQLYKTVYSPMCTNNSSSMKIECICRPAERYKTTNMTYGSFYYDNSLSREKNHVINYDKAAFARCYDNNMKKNGYQSMENSGRKDTSIFSSAFDPQERQLWTQPTNDACCPTDCCNNTSSYYTPNCTKNLTNTSLSQIVPNVDNDSSNIQVRCV